MIINILAVAIILLFIIFAIFPAIFGDSNVTYLEAVIGGAVITFGIIAIGAAFGAFIWALSHIGGLINV